MSSQLFTPTQTLTGWTVGSGAEFALTQNWSAKGEWMYFDLGSDTFVVIRQSSEGMPRSTPSARPFALA